MKRYIKLLTLLTLCPLTYAENDCVSGMSALDDLKNNAPTTVLEMSTALGSENVSQMIMNCNKYSLDRLICEHMVRLDENNNLDFSAPVTPALLQEVLLNTKPITDDCKE